jgi:predicted component of type VI protein secretion system
VTPLVVEVADLAAGATSKLAFIKSPVRIGRSDLNDLPLPHPFVSTWHGVVQFDDESVRYVDLGSTNGSLVDGVRLERNSAAVLSGGTEVRIGSLSLTFRRAASAEAAPEAPKRAPTLFAMRAADLAAAAAPPQAPPEPPPAAGPSPEALAAAERALADAALDLDLLYASHRGTWEHLRSRVEETVGGLAGKAREIALRRIAERYPEIGAERRGAAAPDARAPAPPPAEADGETRALVAAFAESYLPAAARLASRAELEAFLAKLAEALEAFARAYVEMRKGYEEFGKEMGVRTVHADGPLARARDARQLIAWALDPAAQGRAGELQAAYADLMVHQVALLNGVQEGAKALLARLSPDAIAAEAPQTLWPLRAQGLWRAFETRFRDLEEESAVSEALFGNEFARAYGAIVGKRVEAEEERPRRRARR